MTLFKVLLRMDTVGICGSDIKYWTAGSIGPAMLVFFVLFNFTFFVNIFYTFCSSSF